MFIYIYIYIYIHSCMHIYIYIYIRVCICIYISEYTFSNDITKIRACQARCCCCCCCHISVYGSYVLRCCIWFFLCLLHVACNTSSAHSYQCVKVLAEPDKRCCPCCTPKHLFCGGSPLPSVA